jgi:hypothetical protein
VWCRKLSSSSYRWVRGAAPAIARCSARPDPFTGSPRLRAGGSIAGR